MTEYIYKWLDNALDIGIKETDYWNMTLGELERAFNSYARVKKSEAQEKATFDYTLAELIGISVGKIYSSQTKMPEITEVYPSLFDAKEIQAKKQEQLDNLSAIRFRQFAESFNDKFKSQEVAKESE